MYSCSNEKTHTTSAPQAEEVAVPQNLSYTATSISKETVKITVDSQDIMDILYPDDTAATNSIKPVPQVVKAPVNATLSLDIENLSIYETVVNVSCPETNVSIDLKNLDGTGYSDGDTLYEGIISPSGSDTVNLDCLDGSGSHYVVTLYSADAISSEANISVSTKIIFTENVIHGVIGFRRANDPAEDKDYIFF